MFISTKQNYIYPRYPMGSWVFISVKSVPSEVAIPFVSITLTFTTSEWEYDVTQSYHALEMRNFM